MADDGRVKRLKAAEDGVDLQRRNAELRRRNAELESENERLRRRIQQLEGNHEVLPVRHHDADVASEQPKETMPSPVMETPRVRLKGGDLDHRDGEAPLKQVAVASQAAAADPSRSAASPPSHHKNATGGEGGEESSPSATVLDRHDQKWNARYCELANYKAVHGHCKVPQSQRPLGTWVTKQRAFRKKEKLTEERLEKLDDIGFDWGTGTFPTWVDRLEELANYKAEHSHCNVPTSHGPLGDWAHNQRALRKRGKLSKDRVEKLDNLGFDWAITHGKRLNLWDGRYEELKEYRAQHGHSNVPQNEGTLGKWVCNQRQARKKGKLSEDRVRNLENIGFCWGRTQALWIHRYNELRTYKAERGHCNVPHNQEPLASWAESQRLNHRNGKLSEERVQKLDALGFDWSPPRIDPTWNRWNERLEELIKYKAKHHHCNVPFNQGPLGSWVYEQRRNYKKSKLSERRVQKLDGIGFEWSPQSSLSTWNELFGELANYKAMHGHCNVPQSQGALGNWVHNQRTCRRGNTLSKEKIKKLNDLGFDWRVWAPAVVNLELRR